MDILYCSDSNYFSYLRLSILSLIEFNNNVTFHIFTMDCPETDQKALNQVHISQLKNECFEAKKKFQIKLYDVRKQFEEYLANSCNIYNRYTPYAALRLLAPFVLDLDKILYLDGDIIILNSLQDLYNQDFLGKSIIAPRYKDNNGFINGTYLHNLKKEREESFQRIKKAIYIYNNYQHEYPDMSAMVNTYFPDSLPLKIKNFYVYNKETSVLYHISSKELKPTISFLSNFVFSKSGREIRKNIRKIAEVIDKIQINSVKGWEEAIISREEN